MLPAWNAHRDKLQLHACSADMLARLASSLPRQQLSSQVLASRWQLLWRQGHPATSGSRLQRPAAPHRWRPARLPQLRQQLHGGGPVSTPKDSPRLPLRSDLEGLAGLWGRHAFATLQGEGRRVTSPHTSQTGGMAAVGRRPARCRIACMDEGWGGATTALQGAQLTQHEGCPAYPQVHCLVSRMAAAHAMQRQTLHACLKPLLTLPAATALSVAASSRCLRMAGHTACAQLHASISTCCICCAD